MSKVIAERGGYRLVDMDYELWFIQQKRDGWWVVVQPVYAAWEDTALRVFDEYEKEENNGNNTEV